MTRDPAGTFLASWSRAYAARDVPALVGLYAPEALFFGGRPELAEGHDGVRRYFEGLPPHQDPSVEFEVLATRAPHDGVLEVASLGHFSWRGGEARIRFTHTLVGVDGRWLATCHHASPA